MKPLKSLESSRILIESNLVDEIFYTIPEILQHHESFLNALQDRLSSDWDTSQVIGNVFIEAVSGRKRTIYKQLDLMINKTNPPIIFVVYKSTDYRYIYRLHQ